MAPTAWLSGSVQLAPNNPVMKSAQPGIGNAIINKNNEPMIVIGIVKMNPSLIARTGLALAKRTNPGVNFSNTFSKRLIGEPPYRSSARVAIIS